MTTRYLAADQLDQLRRQALAQAEAQLLDATLRLRQAEAVRRAAAAVVAAIEAEFAPDAPEAPAES